MRDYRYLKFFFVFFLAGFVGLPASALAERMAVNVSSANIRSGPGTDYDVLWKAERYYPIRILKKSGGWYKFTDFEGDRGWISKKVVAKIECVILRKNGKCNIRSGPGVENPILFTVEKGVPFRVLEKKGEWLHVQHADKSKGWIHRGLVW